MHSFAELARVLLKTTEPVAHAQPRRKGKETDQRTIFLYPDGMAAEEWCRAYGIPLERDARNRIVLTVTDRHGVPDLPEGYGYKGGAARHLLQSALGMPHKHPPRDYDLVRTAETEPEPGMDAALARRFMERDFHYGDGVEALSDIDAYLAERDLTINEILAIGDKVILTDLALEDTVRRRLRLTEFERNAYGTVGPKMRAKMLRLVAESMDHYLHAEDWEQEVSIDSFWIAVHLDRAMDRGRETAARFIEILRRYRQLPDSVRTPEEVADLLQEEIFFTFANIGQYEEMEKEMERCFYGIQEEMEDGRRGGNRRDGRSWRVR